MNDVTAKVHRVAVRAGGNLLRLAFVTISTLGLSGLACGADLYVDTPFAFTFFATLPSDDPGVGGLHLSPIAFDGPYSVTGISLGGVNSMVTHLRGVQLSGIASFGRPIGPKETSLAGAQIAGAFVGGDNITGMQAAGVFAGANRVCGVQLAGLFAGVSEEMRGVQVAGLFASTESCRGLQISLWNSSLSMSGVQIGAFNFAVAAKDGFVVQIGLVNGIAQDPSRISWSDIRYLPVVNVGW